MEFTIDNLDTIAYCIAQERSKQEQALASPKSNDFVKETARMALRQMQNISDKMSAQMERTFNATGFETRKAITTLSKWN